MRLGINLGSFDTIIFWFVEFISQVYDKGEGKQRQECCLPHILYWIYYSMDELALIW